MKQQKLEQPKKGTKKITEELETLIPQFAKDKATMEDLKKVVDDANAKIKELLDDLGQDEYVTEGLKAKISLSTRVTMDEDKLLFTLKTNLKDSDIDTSNLFYTKEFVNMDELERLLYNDALPKNVVKQVASCKDEKEVKTLRVTKSK